MPPRFRSFPKFRDSQLQTSSDQVTSSDVVGTQGQLEWAVDHSIQIGKRIPIAQQWLRKRRTSNCAGVLMSLLYL